MDPVVDERFDGPPLNLSASLAEESRPTCWLEDLLSTRVTDYNFESGLIFYCVSCSKGLYQGTDFAEGAHHSGHRWLKLHRIHEGICVIRAEIEQHGVNATEIQKFDHERSFFIFLHNDFGFCYAVLSNAEPGESCEHCHTKLDYVSGYYQIRFCSMQCKFRGNANCKRDSLSRELNIPLRRTPPPCELPLPGVSYAHMASQ